MRPKIAPRGDPRRCENCAYFYQHYVLINDHNSSKYIKCYCGHCTYPRQKTTQNNKICDDFLEKTDALTKTSADH